MRIIRTLDSCILLHNRRISCKTQRRAILDAIKPSTYKSVAGCSLKQDSEEGNSCCNRTDHSLDASERAIQ
jgi:hypothetical protein